MSWPVMRPAGVLELRVDHGVTALYLDLHVVNDGVHMGYAIAVRLKFLAGELEGNAAGRVGLAGNELQLDEQPSRTAGVVVARLAGSRPHEMRHEESDFGGSELLARALTGSFRELA